jgi:hypothetical protein
VLFDLGQDSGLQVKDTCKHSTPQLLFGQVAEKSFDHVKPTAAGGREVEVEARMAQPSAAPPRILPHHTSGFLVTKI